MRENVRTGAPETRPLFRRPEKPAGNDVARLMDGLLEEWGISWAKLADRIDISTLGYFRLSKHASFETASKILDEVKKTDGVSEDVLVALTKAVDNSREGSMMRAARARGRRDGISRLDGGLSGVETNGPSTADLAKERGVSRQTMANWARSLGIRGSGRLTEDQIGLLMNYQPEPQGPKQRINNKMSAETLAEYELPGQEHFINGKEHDGILSDSDLRRLIPSERRVMLKLEKSSVSHPVVLSYEDILIVESIKNYGPDDLKVKPKKSVLGGYYLEKTI